MIWKTYKLPIILFPIFCIIIYNFIYHTLIAICFSLILIGLIYGFILAIHQSKPYTVVDNGKVKNKSNTLVKWIIEQIQLSSNNPSKALSIKQHDTHASLEVIIDQICDLFLQDIILPWYKDISSEQETFTETFKEEIRLLVSNLRQRCRKLDWVEIISKDIVELFSDHYEKIQQNITHPRNYPYLLPSYLVCDENETEFLRLLCETILFILLPTSYSSTDAIRHLLREILVFKVIKPTIDLICEPDYFNENILLRIEQSNINQEQKLRKFTLASNYENFIKLIESNDDLDRLEHFWSYIVTEIMQATTIKNLLKEGVISKDNQQHRLGTKGELLINRDLTKYLNQLRRAKIVCERCITANGGRSYLLVDASTNKTNLANRKILTLNMILSSMTGRAHFHQFLETFGNGALVNFWYDIWKLRSALPNERHRVATNIYKVYITSFGSAIVDEIDNTIINRIKSFLVGEQPEPDSFYEAQRIIYEVLQRDYYASFLVSKQYDALCRAFNPKNLQDFDLKEQLFGWSTPMSSTDENFEEIDGKSQMPESPNEEPSQSVPKRLADLRSQLSIKQNALAALKEASTFDKKIIDELERDCGDMNQEISTLECLLENVELWWTHLGQWNAIVLSDVIENGPLCVAALIRSPMNEFGWAINRSLHAWQHFYFRLKELKSSLPNIDLFRVRHQTFSQKQLTKPVLQQLYEQLEKFLQTVLQDEELSAFELVYQFLNPSVIDNDKQSTNILATRKKMTNASKLFRWEKTAPDLSEIENTRHREGRDDSIAEPFYRFIDILFNERGLLKLIRTTLVQFIRVTYGSTINRQVRRSIVSLFQEECIVKYLIMIQDAIWPKIPTLPRSIPTDEEKLERRQQAKRQLLSNLPETVSLMFGSDNARIGIERLFELFQDVRLNKHLCYNLSIFILKKIFPELEV